jgi:hypothetical protein
LPHNGCKEKDKNLGVQCSSSKTDHPRLIDPDGEIVSSHQSRQIFHDSLQWSDLQKLKEIAPEKALSQVPICSKSLP